MAQNCAYAWQADAVPEHGRGGGMTEYMSALMGALDPRPGQGAFHDAFHGGARQRTKRRRLGNKQPRSAKTRSGPFEIGRDRVADLLGERKPFGAPRFSADGKSAVSPVDIGDLEIRNFASPATPSGQARAQWPCRGGGVRQHRRQLHARHLPQPDTWERRQAASWRWEEGRIRGPQGIAQWLQGSEGSCGSRPLRS